MDQLTSFLVSMVALSMGVERIVEMLKGAIAPLRDDPDPATDPGGHRAARRRFFLHILSTLAGTATAMAIGPNHLWLSLPDWPPQQPERLAASLLLGLMASGGSAFWNHALDILGAIKSVREQIATGAAPGVNPPAPLPPPAPTPAPVPVVAFPTGP